MILYHTSYTEIPHPDLQHSRPRLDFGIGFYLTPLRAQAERYGERVLVKSFLHMMASGWIS